MVLENKLGISDGVELARVEERLSKQRAVELFDSGALASLEPGTYEFSLRAWDTQDNASEASLWFVVADDLFLSQVRNFPNPFSDETHITLTHIGDDGNFDVDIEIFDVLGRPVQHLQKRVTSSNGIIEPILWNGCGFSGSPLRSGIYLYRLTLTDEQGYFRTVSQRMVIQR